MRSFVTEFEMDFEKSSNVNVPMLLVGDKIYFIQKDAN